LEQSWTSSAMAGHTLALRHGRMEAFIVPRHSISTSLAWYGQETHPTRRQVSICDYVKGTIADVALGWYDLYDTDEAMNIVAAQQNSIASWIKEHGKNGTSY
jgi:hypothetical protein